MIERAAGKAEEYVRFLCAVQPNRRTGSPGNRAATEYFARTLAPWGWQLDTTPFPCLDHVSGAASLTGAGRAFAVEISPYALGCDVSAPLAVAATIAELENCVAAGKILVLRGELCREQLMPKNFVFYNPEHHQQLYALIERQRPASVITATARDENMVGSTYPFPLIEDGDFMIPVAHCTDLVGDELAKLAGADFQLKLDARRVPTTACNIIARKNPGARRKIVVTAHIDAKETTPGASDNASGTAALLLLAEMLAGYDGGCGVELAALNGEDNYSVAGQMDYLRRYGDKFPETMLAVNIDDVGCRAAPTAWSLYECPGDLTATITGVLAGRPDLAAGEPWFQGDHMIFVQNGVPAMALTSARSFELLKTVTHTPRDTPELLDYRIIGEAAAAVRDLVIKLTGA